MDVGFASEIRGTALIVTFNRPEIRNPLSVPVLNRLSVMLSDHDCLDKLKAIIFTGTGDAFASGADLREIAEGTPEMAREFAERGQSLMNLISAAKQMTIAAVNGYCFGGALDLALSCKRRIASPNAVFSHPGTSLGIITGWGGTQRLPRLIGQASALEMFFTAGRMDANEALRIGLVDTISESVLEAALAMVLADS